MLRRELAIYSLVIFFILTSIPDASCISSPPIIYVAGDGSGDFNCAGKSDQVQINQALQFVAKNSGYTTVHLKGPFTYVIDGTILIGDNTILEGDSTAVIKLANHAGWPTMKPLIQQISGSGNSNITVRGFEVNGNYEGNSEITLGRGYYNVMYFTYCNNVKVYDMYMHDGTGDGLRINQGKNVQFYNNTIYKLGHDGLFAIRCDNVEARNNRVTCRTNSALRIWNSKNVKLHDNFIDSFYHWSAGGPGIQIEKSTGGTVSNVEVYGNVINNTFGPAVWIIGYGDAYPREEAQSVNIHNNIFFSTGTNPSIDWVGGIVASGFYNTFIENNVFDGVYHAAILEMYPADHTDLAPQGEGYTTIVRNNIIVNTLKRKNNPDGTGQAVINYQPGTDFFLLENNCFYHNVGGDYKNCSATTDIYVNPLVANLNIHDYHLLSTAGRWDGKNWVKDNMSSLCIDAGYRYSNCSNEPEPNGKRINIGPDGNTKYASKSEFLPSSSVPTADFSCNVTTGVVPLSVQFTDHSRNVTARNWDFGDGTNSIQQNPMHTYSAAGNYTVNLTAINDNGTSSKLATINVSRATGSYAYISNGWDNIVSVIDTATNNVTATVKTGTHPWGVAVSSDGEKVYVTNVYSNSISIIDTATNTVKATVYGFNEPWGVAVNPDGKTVYVANSASNKVSVIDTVTNTIAETVIVGNNPRGVAVSPDGKKVYVTNQNSNNISIIDTATNSVTATVSAGKQPWGVAFSQDGTKVYVANYGSSTVTVIDATSNSASATVPVGPNPVGVAFTPDGTKAYVTNFGSNTVSVINKATDTIESTVGVGNNPYGVSFTPDGTKAYVANQNSNNVSIIDTETSIVTATVNVGRSVALGQFIVPPGTT